MITNHTTACGTEPFDQVYSLGYQVHHDDWSPFPRVNRLRQTFLDRPYEIDVERLRLVTEAYQKHEGEPRKLQCAYAFENILLNTSLYIYDEDLILGEIAAPAKASPIYPEFSVNWIIDEILHSPSRSVSMTSSTSATTRSALRWWSCASGGRARPWKTWSAPAWRRIR